MDAQQQLVWDAATTSTATVVLGHHGSFLLVNLAGPTDEAVREAKARGFAYYGVLGVVNGQAVAQFEPGLGDMRAVVAAALEFGSLFADRLKKQEGDAVAWLDALHSLEDPR